MAVLGKDALYELGDMIYKLGSWRLAYRTAGDPWLMTQLLGADGGVLPDEAPLQAARDALEYQATRWKAGTELCLIRLRHSSVGPGLVAAPPPDAKKVQIGVVQVGG